MSVFCIGKFPNENDVVAVFPKMWTQDNGSQCWWPPKNASKAAEKQRSPKPGSWSLCKVVILKEFDTFNEARENLDLSTVTSDLDAAGQGIETTTGGDLIELLSPPPPPQPRLVAVDQMDQNVELNVECPRDGLNGSLHQVDVLSFEDAPTKTTDAYEQKLTELQESISRIHNVQKEHSETLDLILNNLLSLTGVTRTIEGSNLEDIHNKFVFPLQIPAQLLELDNYLSTDAGKGAMKRYLCGTGGADADDAVKRSLEKLMTDDLLCNFSLRGKRGKDPLINFNNLVITLKECVRGFPSLTMALSTGRLDDRTLDSSIASALKKASDRVFQRKKKAAAPAQHP